MRGCDQLGMGLPDGPCRLIKAEKRKNRRGWDKGVGDAEGWTKERQLPLRWPGRSPVWRVF